MPLTLIRPPVLALGLVGASTTFAAAQSLFSPAVRVNDKVITHYEVEQRARMMVVLNSPGDTQEQAIEQLIEDRLKLEAAQAAGIVPTAEEIEAAIADFAAQGSLEPAEFLKALETEGVASQTFRDFVTAGIAWRELVRARFGNRSLASEAEIDRAISSSQTGGGVRVLLSEIIMPATPETREEVRERANRIAQYRTIAEFSSAAREFSATATRGAGGRLPWQNVSELPPVLQPLILGLAPGQVTDPLPLPNAVALFQLRAIEETNYVAPSYAAVEYAMYYLPGGRSPETLAKARVIAQSLDRCDDLYGVAKGQPEEVLDRMTQPPADVPGDVAIELSKMDAGEISTALTRNNGQTLVLLMLCGRTAAVNEDADRENIALGLRNRRIGSFADGYLAELKADAYIVRQ
ncbi:SurA N-terminal domain-containing protein [Pseudoprimorskyibacter insulae]|uniref:Parvulin-like PPIase n=1 Tax=Pseudoprimorskyibacter insulae TaxID=1695997 RepID=A0A2R8AW94_9RHOB|nr:peptidylprolyl isomerase [Pseudoprimorskyibacter insulae]SPF80187.1 Chaperone SurA [Pseudoprimorskyibacter insulae]